MRKNKTQPELGDFNRWGKRIVKKTLEARDADAEGDIQLLRETEWGALAYYVYEYVDKLECADLFEDLRTFLGPSPGPRPSRTGLVLRLMEKVYSGPEPYLLSPSRRSRLSDALELARGFEVEAKLVLGFFSELGTQEAVSEIRVDKSKLDLLDGYRKSGAE